MDMNLYRMIYKKGKNESNIRILGKKFVKNNRNKGFLIINNKKISLRETIQIKQNKIILMLNKDIYNKSCMFKNCESLETFSIILPNDVDCEYSNQKNENNIKNTNLFNYWDSGTEIENFSMISEVSLRDEKSLDNLNELYILYFSNKLKYSSNNYAISNEMFSNCKSLISLPDILEMKTNYVFDMSYMFSNVNL